MKLFKKTNYFLLFAAFCGLFYGYWALKEDDLELRNLTSHFPPSDEWKIKNLTTEEQADLNTILSQAFTYLDEGGYSSVFLSADKRYVIKFFKFRRLKPARWVEIISYLPFLSKFRDNHAKQRASRFHTNFTGHKVAYEQLRHESRIIHVQLNPTHHFQKLLVQDKKGHKRELDLGPLVYVLQEKGESLMTIFSQLLKQGHVEAVKNRIHQIFALYLDEYRKGIIDTDHRVMHNRGFIGNAPFHLDVGKVMYDPEVQDPKIHQKDLAKVARRMKLWIKDNFPQYALELNQDIDQKVAHIFGA